MIYVDNANIKFGRMKMFHLIADTQDELLDFAEKLSIDIRHIQFKDTYKEHFDISKSKKELALKFGAIEISTKEIIIKMKEKEVK
jgi:hypothetical protein